MRRSRLPDAWRVAALALTGLLLTCDASFGADAGGTARNVILMIADGAGYNAWKALSMYEGDSGAQLFEAPGWTKLAVSVHALRPARGESVALEAATIQNPAMVYDPARAWDPTPVEGRKGRYPFHFEGYRWLLRYAPDSASTATAIVTGQKTYDGAINVDGNELPIEQTLPAIAKRLGKRVGTVSTVVFSHATVAAAGGVSNKDRGNYCSLTVAMLTSPVLDVIAGCGNPDFDNNGELLVPERRIYEYVGNKEIWDSLTGRAQLAADLELCADESEEDDDWKKKVRVTPEQMRAIQRWTLRQSLDEIRSLVGGPTPDKLLIVPAVGQVPFDNGQPREKDEPPPVRVGATLQQSRGSRANPRFTPPGYDPTTTTVPSLATLTRVALNALDDDPDGFFLHVEGGGVDWAMHDNQMGRMIEELIDFRDAVDAVVAWIGANGGWDENLLIVTGDHDHLLWGPESHIVPFQPLTDNGPGRLPSYRWLSDHHSAALIPVFARGAGADRLPALAVHDDPFRGPYVDQTDLFRIMRRALGGSEASDADRSALSP